VRFPSEVREELTDAMMDFRTELFRPPRTVAIFLTVPGANAMNHCLPESTVTKIADTGPRMSLRRYATAIDRDNVSMLLGEFPAPMPLVSSRLKYCPANCHFWPWSIVDTGYS
jgi:hypothetical protein